MKLNFHIYPLLILRISGTVTPLPYKTSWRAHGQLYLTTCTSSCRPQKPRHSQYKFSNVISNHHGVRQRYLTTSVSTSLLFFTHVSNIHISENIFLFLERPSLCVNQLHVQSWNQLKHTTFIVFIFLWRCEPTRVMASSFLRFTRSHTTTHHSR
jgi:hypothetical protein